MEYDELLAKLDDAYIELFSLQSDKNKLIYFLKEKCLYNQKYDVNSKFDQKSKDILQLIQRNQLLQEQYSDNLDDLYKVKKEDSDQEQILADLYQQIKSELKL
ncbi:hypothetical protein SS50377_20900 [Spironucleus salmonicida]|uniref:Uncharacterized protein n=1 Tax=Spironucleus salmonicida TaxID=348837 RepID=A0A9P8M021_9EUKA|nr:hypothetical protein SS50377_20900 [Spironucleus salmonicida]